MRSAYDEAVALLARRPLSERELAARLHGRGHDGPGVDDAIRRLTASGAIDDRELARHWLATRAASRGRGRERSLAELEARGVDPAVAASVWREAVEGGDVDEAASLERAVRRRLGPPPGRASRTRLARVYNALLHEGFEPGAIDAALRPYGFEGTDP
ncbi:MAG TPA: regulatory protein RecX [Candidatus Polarisedimenticolaceae bacterium]|nr:regulatory protein RecX [Candidatus Polarisedimenticolaceae bacterium]